jgi:trehalose 6-phosphate phosphatase
VPEAHHQHSSRPAAPDPEHPKPPDVFGLGLAAFLFDLDGVVTRTASLHAQAWRRLFDEFLAERASGGDYVPFRLPDDYIDHVDGKPRYEGVRSFLRSRGIDLPFGAPSDAPSGDTVCGLGNRKNRLFLQVLDEQGVEVFEGTLAFIRALRAADIKTACVSSSKNCRPVLDRAGLTEQFDLIYDGNDLERDELPGKPRPDSFLRTAELVGVDPSRAAVVEDAIVGVAAGRSGGFRLVIGVDRGAGREALLGAGADVVVSDLSELDVRRPRA